MLGTQILNDARKMNPDHQRTRILLGEEDFARILKNRNDPLIVAAIQAVKNEFEAFENEEPSKYVIPDGVRLLATSRRVLRRVYCAGMLYKLFGEEKYAARAWVELSAAAAFPDFHECHFLDCAELCAALAIGYDWLYNWFTPEQRKTLSDAIFEKGIMPFYREYHYVPRSGYPWYKDHPGDNWKMVCNGGLTMAILAIFEEHPSELYDELLTLAYCDCERAVLTFFSGNDGTYSEGPMYWGYATQYLLYYINTLTHSCGTDYGMSDWKGMEKSPYWLMALASNDHRSFNFGDAWCSSVVSPHFFWFGHRYRDYALNAMTGEHLMKNMDSIGAATGLYLLSYYHPDEMNKATELPTANGAVGSDNAAFRSGWGEEDIFVGFHTGRNDAYHGHLDMGNFILNVGSARFFHDFNPDNYNLKPYSSTYRYRAEGHNVIVINPSPENDQIYNSAAKIDKICVTGRDNFAVSDLSAAYPEGRNVVRGIKLLGEAKTVIIRDEITALPEDVVLWYAQTESKPQIAEDGKSAVLSLLDKRLWVGLFGDGVITVRPAAPDENSPIVKPALSESGVFGEQRVNTGCCKLTVKLSGKDKYTVNMVCIPLADGEDKPAAIPELTGLNEW